MKSRRVRLFLCGGFRPLRLPPLFCSLNLRSHETDHAHTMGLVLSIETSTKVCSVSLQKGGELLGLKELYIDKSHSELLAPLMRDLVQECGYSMKNLDAVAVAKGPGSYTGLRIGVSAAKGLCFALDIPLMAVNTLMAMAAGITKFNVNNYLLCPMLDARRMEVYCLVMDNHGVVIRDTQAMILDEHSFSEDLSNSGMIFFGPGADKAELLLSRPGAVHLKNIFPSATGVGRLAYEKFRNKDYEDVAYFEPFYLKEFITRKPKPKF